MEKNIFLTELIVEKKLFDITNMFLNSVSPVAIVFLFGYVAGKKKIFLPSDVIGLFKFIANISAPAIMINILITTDISILDTNLLILYIISELLTYLSAFLICKYFLKLSFGNALLCGLAASFGNHVLFVYPIALFAFPSEMITPVKGIIIADIFIFTFTLVWLDIISKVNLKKIIAVGKQFQNPIFMGLVLGLLLRFSPLKNHTAIVHGSEFISYAAAPCGLFASGILLAQTHFLGNIKLAGILTFFKMIFHPILGFCLIIIIGEYSIHDAQTTLMVTAAPVGIMAVTFANQYKMNAEAVAQAVLWSFLLSILWIPILGSL